MLLIVHPSPLKMMANSAAAYTNCTAVALAGRSAAFVAFQRHQANHPPTQNVNSAPRSLTSARHFSGNNAKYAICATTTATFTTFGAASV